MANLKVPKCGKGNQGINQAPERQSSLLGKFVGETKTAGPRRSAWTVTAGLKFAGQHSPGNFRLGNFRLGINAWGQLD
jgi:hypothetical protein